MQNTFTGVYEAGCADERRVVRFLADHFPRAAVRPSGAEENIMQDIDCFVDDLRVSIKAQHSGLEYNNIYMELAQCPRLLYANHAPLDNGLQDVEHLVADHGWVPSWYYTGTVDIYAILQERTLRLYNKQDIVDYVDTHGFSHCRSLSSKRRQYLIDANYRYSNAICGYLPTNAIQHISLDIPAPSSVQRRAAPIKKPLILCSTTPCATASN